jgi:hypothetical protein
VGVACNEKFAMPIFLPFWQELVLISFVIANHNILKIKRPLNWGKSNFEGWMTWAWLSTPSFFIFAKILAKL